jgi:hypothetical protein
MVRGVLVGQADSVGKLLNSGLTAVERIEQRDSRGLGYHPQAAGGQLNDIRRKRLSRAGSSFGTAPID